MNTLKTVFLMTLMTVLFLFVGNLLGGQSGLMIAFVFALIMNFGSYWFSDKIVLAMYKARQVDAQAAPKLFSMVQDLSARAALPMPRVYVIDNPTPNAFATGRNPNNAAVAVTTGILKILNNDELAGVIAHELAHIKHRDILIGTIAATFVGTITYLAQMASWAMMFGGRSSDREEGGSAIGSLVMIILAPIAATLLQLAISRSREFLADEGGAEITGNPMGLASALNKLVQANEIRPIEDAKPATAHMFIVSPLSGGGVTKLFSTHPPIEERVNRLRLISQRM
ncbi:MAG: zinc metalloprotease HtpX [Ignavibacteriaceae bacterium]|nr:zinc metalloprotease HtpX [Ignavibacteriaceae bacterium]HRI47185.1 zinc metalloprotease HtpX [Ignavibacteriaceae bacterium]